MLLDQPGAGGTMRFVGGLLVSLLVALTACGSSEPTEVSSGAPDGDAMPVSELTLQQNGEAITVGGETLFIADGLSGSGEARTFRLWSAPASGDAVATPTDYPEIGPLGWVTMLWIDDELVVAGLRCPKWTSPRALSEYDEWEVIDVCGSEEWAAFGIDPSTGTSRLLFDDPSYESLKIAGGADGQLLFTQNNWERVALVDDEGGVVALDGQPTEPHVDGSAIACPTDAGLVTVRPSSVESPVPLESLLSATLIDGGAQTPLTLPETGRSGKTSSVLGCVEGGVAVSAIPSRVSGAAVMLLQVAEDGRATWEARALPLSDPDMRAVHFGMIGGTVVANTNSLPMVDPVSEPAPESYTLNGGSWDLAKTAPLEPLQAGGVFPPTGYLLEETSEIVVLTFTEGETINVDVTQI